MVDRSPIEVGQVWYCTRTADAGRVIEIAEALDGDRWVTKCIGGGTRGRIITSSSIHVHYTRDPKAAPKPSDHTLRSQSAQTSLPVQSSRPSVSPTTVTIAFDAADSASLAALVEARRAQIAELGGDVTPETLIRALVRKAAREELVEASNVRPFAARVGE